MRLSGLRARLGCFFVAFMLSSARWCLEGGRYTARKSTQSSCTKVELIRAGFYVHSLQVKPVFHGERGWDGKRVGLMPQAPVPRKDVFFATVQRAVCCSRCTAICTCSPAGSTRWDSRKILGIRDLRTSYSDCWSWPLRVPNQFTRNLCSTEVGMCLAI